MGERFAVHTQQLCLVQNIQVQQQHRNCTHRWLDTLFPLTCACPASCNYSCAALHGSHTFKRDIHCCNALTGLLWGSSCAGASANSERRNTSAALNTTNTSHSIYCCQDQTCTLAEILSHTKVVLSISHVSVGHNLTLPVRLHRETLDSSGKSSRQLLNDRTTDITSQEFKQRYQRTFLITYTVPLV